MKTDYEEEGEEGQGIGSGITARRSEGRTADKEEGEGEKHENLKISLCCTIIIAQKAKIVLKCLRNIGQV